MKKTTSGFTIVELLVVIVVIGILAGITMVAYNGVQNRANDVTVQSDMNNIATIMELARLDSATFSYPTTNAAIATAGVVKVSKKSYATTTTVAYNLLFCFPTTSNPDQFVLTAQSKSGKKFYLRNNSVLTEYTGGSSWGGTPSTICDSLDTGWTASGAGYAASDGTTGPWRSWAGGN